MNRGIVSNEMSRQGAEDSRDERQKSSNEFVALRRQLAVGSFDEKSRDHWET